MQNNSTLFNCHIPLLCVIFSRLKFMIYTTSGSTISSFSPLYLLNFRWLARRKMCSINLIFLSAISLLLSAITCTKINPETYGGEGICQYPDCNPQFPPPSTYQPSVAPPPPKPISPPPPSPPPPAPVLPPPAPTGYTPYGVAPPPPPGYPVNYPPPPPVAEGDQQPAESLPSPPPSLYTYLDDSSSSAASPPAFGLCSNICTAVVYIMFLFATFLYV